MSIVKMSKLRLFGLASDKNKILDEIYLSACAHIKPVDRINGTTISSSEEEIQSLEQDWQKTNRALEVINKIGTKNAKIECSFNDFLKQGKQIEKTADMIEEINNIIDAMTKNYNSIIKLKNEQIELIPVEIKKMAHLNLENKSKQSNKEDENTQNILDRIYKELMENNDDILSEYDILNLKMGEDKKLFVSYRLKREDYNALEQDLDDLRSVLDVKSVQEGIFQISYLFKNSIPEFTEEMSLKLHNLNEKIKEFEQKNAELFEKIKSYYEHVDEIKLSADYITYRLEKERAEQFMAKTESTFVLECYVAKTQAKEFMEKLQHKFDALVITEQPITSKDMPPTITKNNKVVKQADFVVNMYSVPQYNEVDPTWSVFLFFMIFFGFIMADVGYGIILTVVGFLLARRIKEENGAKRLWSLIGVGGIFAIVWGFLFGSFFGFSHAQLSIIPAGIMPDPQNDSILLLLVCLLMGILQIAFGYAMRGVNAFKRGRICDGVVNGVAWVFFLLGLIMAFAGYLLNFFKIGMSSGVENFMNAIAKPGLIMMLVSLGVGVIFAGIGTKGFTKLTKSFSALYGIINLFSDILSYARLFGLMLSSAIIAQQFNSMALGVMTSPIGYILGALILLIGHAFNVAMGTLSAYIHDVRLQYVEYFGKFYNGDGTEFTPFGVKLNYVKFID